MSIVGVGNYVTLTAERFCVWGMLWREGRTPMQGNYSNYSTQYNTAQHSQVHRQETWTLTYPQFSLVKTKQWNLKLSTNHSKWVCVHSLTFLPTYTGMPIIMAGIAMPAISAMPTGAPTSVPSCQRIFFFLLHGFFPQKVQPDGLDTARWETWKIQNLIEQLFHAQSFKYWFSAFSLIVVVKLSTTCIQTRIATFS